MFIKNAERNSSGAEFQVKDISGIFKDYNPESRTRGHRPHQLLSTTLFLPQFY